MKNILDRENIKSIVADLKLKGKKIVFTNGCFDVLHAGHVDYLCKSKELGDVLIVGLNSDISIRKIKGEKRPIVPENERAMIIANLKSVDYVSLFDEETPYELIKEIIPDILVKGSDWKEDEIVGGDIVKSNGGSIERIDFITQQSTTNIINTILERYK